jgi:hypothetical protein
VGGVTSGSPPPWRVPSYEPRRVPPWQVRALPASPSRRLEAAVADAALLAVPIGAAGAWLVHTDATGAGWPSPRLISLRTLEVVPPRPELGLALGSLALVLAYFGLGHGVGRGSTPGEHLAGVAVRRAPGGETLGVPRALLRCAIRLVLYLGLVVLALQTAERPWWQLVCCLAPGVMNDLRPLWNPRHQSFADSAAGSVVVCPFEIVPR